MEKIWCSQYPAGVPQTIEPHAYRSVVDLFDRSVRKFGSCNAFTNSNTTLTFSELEALSRSFAAYLQQVQGIKKQDCIAVMLPNLLQFPIAFFGAIRTGARITNVNPLYTPVELEHQLSDAGAKVIVVCSDAMPVLAKILAKTTIEAVIIVRSDDRTSAEKTAGEGNEHPQEAVEFSSALVIGEQLDCRPVALDHDDILFLQYTGGTTGFSKGATLTHCNIIANILQFSAVLGPKLNSGREIVMTALPLYHIFALTVNCLAFIHHGGHNVLIANPRNMPALITEFGKWKFTVMTGVNTLFNLLLDSARFRALDFSALKITIGGGAAIQRGVAERWFETTCCHILEGYGLSETSPLLTLNPYTATGFTGSIGLPMPSTDISLRNEEGNEVSIGEAGELWVRGPQLMRGYWKQEAATRETMTPDGFFKTGDIATMDAQGYFRIVDRKKDVILVSGFNVFPNEIESAVARCNGVLESRLHRCA
jgi:long-chain acyl-CoA synthetase